MLLDLKAKSDKIFVGEGGMTNKFVTKEWARRGRNGAVFWVNLVDMSGSFAQCI